MRPHDLTRCQLLLRFGYDGARFRGVQPQAPGIPTAGLALRERLTEAAGVPPKALNFAARTDSGVHAIGNLATCYFRDVDEAATARLLERVQALRDDGLVDVRAYRVPPTVHARGSARGKRYRYTVIDGVAAPLAADDERARHAWLVAPALDVQAMRAAAAHFIGTHDFSSLRAGDCSAASAVKTLARIDVTRVAGEKTRAISVEVSGNAFLRKMVRNLVGVLVEVGAACRSVDDIDAMLAARVRAAAGLCAPPQGLTLVAVGCTWPPDGSALLPELAQLDKTDDEE